MIFFAKNDRRRMPGRAAWVLLALLATSAAGHAGAADDAAARELEQRYHEALGAIEQGNADEAVALLESLILSLPDHAGAWLDLAILMCQGGEARRAEALFRHIETRFAPPPAIREVIAHHRRSGCAAPPRLPLRGQLSLIGGWDSNTTLGVPFDSVVLHLGGIPTEVQVAPSQRARGSLLAGFEAELGAEVGRHGTAVLGYLSGRRFAATEEFDNFSWGVAVSQPLSWRNGPAATLSAGWIDWRQSGQAFQRTAYVSWFEPLHRGAQRAGAPGWALELTAQHNRFEHNRNFDAQVRELRLHHGSRLGAGSFALSLGRVEDHAEGDRPGGDRNGWSVQLAGQHPLPGANRFDVLLRSVRLDSSRPYAPGLLPVRRESEIRLARVTLAHRLGADSEVRVQLRRLQNRDKIPLFEYTSNAAEVVWWRRWR